MVETLGCQRLIDLQAEPRDKDNFFQCSARALSDPTYEGRVKAYARLINEREAVAGQLRRYQMLFADFS